MKIDRLIGILMILINKRKVTAKQLSEHFEVSVRTIQRDLDTLDMAGIPLYGDVGVNGGYRLNENFRIEKGFLNKDEAGILYTFLKELEEVTPYSEVASIYNKFSGLEKHDFDSSKLVVQLNPAHNTRNFREHLSLLSEARDRQKKLKIAYLDVKFNSTGRIICPYTLVLVNSTWYVYAYCDLRENFRMFKVSRISSCELLDDSFGLKEIPEELPWETIVKNERIKEEIILEIDRNNPHILPDYIEPSRCEVSEDKIIVRLEFVIDEWLYSQLMAMVPFVKIIKPDSLRKGFVNMLKKSLSENNYDIQLS